MIVPSSVKKLCSKTLPSSFLYRLGKNISQSGCHEAAILAPRKSKQVKKNEVERERGSSGEKWGERKKEETRGRGGGI